MNMISIKVSSPEEVRAYGLASDHVAAMYLHHYSNNSSEMDGLKVEINLLNNINLNSEWIGEWIDPETGKTIELVTLKSGLNWLEAPTFRDDIAFIGKLN